MEPAARDNPVDENCRIVDPWRHAPRAHPCPFAEETEAHGGRPAPTIDPQEGREQVLGVLPATRRLVTLCSLLKLPRVEVAALLHRARRQLRCTVSPLVSCASRAGCGALYAGRTGLMGAFSGVKTRAATDRRRSPTGLRQGDQLVSWSYALTRQFLHQHECWC